MSISLSYYLWRRAIVLFYYGYSNGAITDTLIKVTIQPQFNSLQVAIQLLIKYSYDKEFFFGGTFMTKQELKALWEYAEFLELTEKGSKLYQQVKELLIKEIISGEKKD